MIKNKKELSMKSRNKLVKKKNLKKEKQKMTILIIMIKLLRKNSFTRRERKGNIQIKMTRREVIINNFHSMIMIEITKNITTMKAVKNMITRDKEDIREIT